MALPNQRGKRGGGAFLGMKLFLQAFKCADPDDIHLTGLALCPDRFSHKAMKPPKANGVIPHFAFVRRLLGHYGGAAKC